MSTVNLPAVNPHCDSGLTCEARLCWRVKVTRAKTLPNDAQKRDAAIVVAITTVTLVLVQGDYVDISHVCYLSSLPAQAEELMKRLQDGLLPMLQNFRRDNVLPRRLATGETVDGYAELSQCRRVVKLLYDWHPRQGNEGSVCDDVLPTVE